MFRYFWSLALGSLAVFGGGLYLYETFRLERLEKELIRASIPTFRIARTPDQERQLMVEEENRVARYGALADEARWAAARSHGGVLLCLGGVIAALLALPGFVRTGTTARGGPPDTARTLFISYNHKNLDLAKQLQGELRAAGVQAELIEAILDVQSDQELKTILESRILNHPAVLVLLTPESLRSQWVAFERALADRSLVSVIYACNRVSLGRAIWATNFLPRGQSFRAVRMLKAQRRYVSYPDEKATRLIAGHVDLAVQQAAGISPVRQFLASFSSLDLMFFTWLFNRAERGVILAPESRLRRVLLKLCMALQIYLALVPVLLIIQLLPWVVMAVSSYWESFTSD